MSGKTLLLILALTLPGAMAAAALPAPFIAKYDASVKGFSGEAIMQFERGDNGLLIVSTTTRAHGIARLAQPRPAVERSEFRYATGRLQPLEFFSEDGTRRNKRGNRISFDWSAGAARSHYEETDEQIELHAGLLDRQLMQIALMRDLAAGRREATYRIVDRHDLKTYEARVSGEERITVAAGEFDTVRVERARPGSSRMAILWCAPELDYLPVRMHQLKDDKLNMELELTSVTR